MTRDIARKSGRWLLWGLAVVAIPLPVPAADGPSISWAAPKDVRAGDIARLADEVLARYREPDRATYLDNAAMLQFAAKRDGDAARSLDELVALRRASPQPLDAAGAIRWQIYLRARQVEAGEGLAFDAAYRRAFHEEAVPRCLGDGSGEIEFRVRIR